MLLGDAAVIGWIDETARALLESVTGADPATPIPACPRWTMADLVAHLAPMYSGWYRYNLRHPVGEGDQPQSEHVIEPSGNRGSM